MHRLLLKLTIIISTFLLPACQKRPPQHKNATVRIEKINGKFSLYKNGKPYVIKGASGYSHLDILAAAGGNTIRVWDTTNVASVLKSAKENGISVIIGIPLPESRFLEIYNDKQKVAQQLQGIKSLVNRYKNHPSVLMWCVGNELVFPYKLEYNNFYKAFNGIVDMIHKDDPNHPVTTTMINFQRKEIFNMTMRTNVDLLSFNTFSRINTLSDDLKDFSWFWNGPFLITEWAIDGPWQDSPHNAWAANIEPTSTKKAEHYLERYKKYMPVDNLGFLGSFIFYWGQKQEATHTWFSLFDENGNKTEVIDAAQEIWTGKKSGDQFPQINYMLLNEKGAKDNILTTPGADMKAAVSLLQTSTDIDAVKWEIYPEDWFKKNNVNNTIKPAAVNTWTKTNDLNTSFTAPAKPGPYRLFVSVSDGKGNVATTNTPFYVIAAP